MTFYPCSVYVETCESRSYRRRDVKDGRPEVSSASVRERRKSVKLEKKV